MKYYYKLFVHFHKGCVQIYVKASQLPVVFVAQLRHSKCQFFALMIQPLAYFSLKKNACSTIFNQGYESSDFNLISDFFCSSQNPIFKL